MSAVPSQQQQVTTLADLRKPQAPEAQLPQVQAGFFDLQSFELMQRIAKGFASSSLVPKEYQGNIANCMIALNLAQRIKGDPLMTMQSLTIVHGRPTWSSQFLLATANMCGRFSAIRFEFFGKKGTDEWGCRAWAIERATNEKLIGADITIGLAKKEGWYDRNGSKWKTMPQQMLMYRAGAWWVRAYAPELSMGLMSADEAGDVYDVTPTQTDEGVSLGDLRGDEHIDRDTGEITDERSGTPPTDEAPTWADVERLIADTDYAAAEDVAKALGMEAQAKEAIAKHRKGTK
jgi:hypothetical protein